MDYIQPITHQSKQPNRKEIEMKNQQYVVVVAYDSCDPVIYGPYQSEERAEKAKKAVRRDFTDYDWRHHVSLTTEKLWTVK